MLRFLCFVAALLCLWVDPTWVAGGRVPKDQAAAVATVMAAIFFVACLILGQIAKLERTPNAKEDLDGK